MYQRRFVFLLVFYKCSLLYLLASQPIRTFSILLASRSAEVVGASGRIGSLFLRSIPNATATPRGIAPGCLSSGPGSPILVATPSKSWPEIHRQTLPERRNDLVWIGNGLLSERFQRNGTVVIPHFAVLQVNCDDPVTSAESPPTYLYGRHVDVIDNMLVAKGVRVEHVEAWDKICVYAAQKLLWASCMWLLCHASSPPLTVSQVHEQKQNTLEQLVRELSPAFQTVIGSNESMSLQATLNYMKSYSNSMPEAVPSLDLAMTEIVDRNGVWLMQEMPQPLHRKLLLDRIGSKAMQHLVNKASLHPAEENDLSHSTKQVVLPEIQLQCYGTNRKGEPDCETVIIVGGGIIGSSLALSLARRGCKVTVVDPNPIGVTSPASWAWINANQKKPMHYKWLNQLGMRAWRLDSVVRDLPSWKGALVCVRELLESEAGYRVTGPLSVEEWKELEPEADFPDGHIYYFEEEGCVDPSHAVKTIRKASKCLGVSFISNQNVTSFLRNDRGKVIGIRSQDLKNKQSVETLADVVVLAAGTGCASLAGVPLLFSPGRISYAKPSTATKHLNRLLVDTILQSHVLQRKDGTIVVGGGTLIVGGSSDKVNRDNLGADSRGQRLLDSAKQIAPGPVNGSTFLKSEEAVRPMPSDGQPVAGYLESGLYAVVTHSGVTLAPILGKLVAAELTEKVDLEILSPYRPSRLQRN